MVDLGDDLHAALERADFVSMHTPADARHPPPHRRRRAGAHEAHGDPRQHRARPDRRPGRARRRAARGPPRAAPASTSPTPSRSRPTTRCYSAPNLLVVPHIGSATTTARAAMADRAVDNLLAALDGKPMPYAVHQAVARAYARRRRRHRHELHAPARRRRRRRRRADRARAPHEGHAARRPPRADGRARRRRRWSACSPPWPSTARSSTSSGAERTVAVLTSAVRDAANGEDFLARVRAQSDGLDARVIAGDEEARLTFRGATSERAAGDATPTRRHRRRRRLDRARRRQRRRGELPRLDAGRRRAPHRAPPRAPTRRPPSELRALRRRTSARSSRRRCPPRSARPRARRSPWRARRRRSAR